MSSAARQAANKANAQHSTGPTSPEGRATCARNGIQHGLFADRDVIRPGEESIYREMGESLRLRLVPEGLIEEQYVDEIRRAMWRLRRCGTVEATFLSDTATDSHTGIELPDPMDCEATEKRQASVDRARAQCLRLLQRCTTELRKLQTERHIQNECNPAGTDLSSYGLMDWRLVMKALDEQLIGKIRYEKNQSDIACQVLEAEFAHAVAIPPGCFPSTFAESHLTKQTQPSRNSRCKCGSGLKFKRCCGLNSAQTPADPPQDLPKAA